MRTYLQDLNLYGFVHSLQGVSCFSSNYISCSTYVDACKKFLATIYSKTNFFKQLDPAQFFFRLTFVAHSIFVVNNNKWYSFEFFESDAPAYLPSCFHFPYTKVTPSLSNVITSLVNFVTAYKRL